MNARRRKIISRLASSNVGTFLRSWYLAADGLLGKEARIFVKKLSCRLAEKWEASKGMYHDRKGCIIIGGIFLMSRGW
jgi:hypothetical protein